MEMGNWISLQLNSYLINKLKLIFIYLIIWVNWYIFFTSQECLGYAHRGLLYNNNIY